MKIYLASALTHVPDDDFLTYTGRLHRVAGALSDGGKHEVRYALMNSDPQLAAKPPGEQPKLCYLWDRKMVEEADVVVAEASFPSLGLGIELQIAEQYGVPVVLCFEESEDRRSKSKIYENPGHQKHELQIGEGYISLMALGLPNVLSLIAYADESQLVQKVEHALELLGGH